MPSREHSPDPKLPAPGCSRPCGVSAARIVSIEIRHQGGAFARMPETPSAVGVRPCGFWLNAIAAVMPPGGRAGADEFGKDRVRSASSGSTATFRRPGHDPHDAPVKEDARRLGLSASFTTPHRGFRERQSAIQRAWITAGMLAARSSNNGAIQALPAPDRDTVRMANYVPFFSLQAIIQRKSNPPARDGSLW